MKHFFLVAALSLVLCAGGCVTSAKQGVLDTGGQSQLRLRQMQTRSFETNDKKKNEKTNKKTQKDIQQKKENTKKTKNQ